MKLFISKMQMVKHRGLLEDYITGIAVVSSNMTIEFAGYYDSIMPMMLSHVQNPNLDSQTNGKAGDNSTITGKI